tara:strand:+ start:202 stop:846 length:645 start_codon:yes stop_codon:yes gene_type:complete
MDQEIEIINNATRKERIINFFIKNKKKLITILIFFILILLGFFTYQIYKTGHQELLADKYNSAVTNYESEDKSKVIEIMKEIINDKDKTYSPLALYFLMDNDLLKSKEEINNLFNIIINDVNLDKEIKYLIIYKKGLYNSEFVNEEKLLSILNPVITSKSIWKSHALYLMAEYFFSKGEKIKSKEFYEQIILLENSNLNIKIEAEKRIKRDFSE